MSYEHNSHRINMLRLLAAATMFTLMTPVASHGRLMDPPARNSMWRLGFANPVNYNDNELYCGGRVTQWARNKGKCGVCGDPYHNIVKDHEVGGKYANGIISREYMQGGTVEIIVHITANHKGYFEFRICPVEDPKVEVTQECLDTHLMMMANGEGSRYFLPEGKSNQFFNVSIKLPEDVTCKQCVVQWKYRTGNTWDKDEGGNFCVGCGPQEEFYNCADVTIHPRRSPEEDHQTGNSKPSMQGEGAEISPSVDRLHKKEGKSISGKNDNLKSAADNTISNYGKQKVHFIQKLDSNKYSSWAKPKSTGVRSPFVHLARKSSEGSGRNSSNSLRLVSGGRNMKLSSVTRSQPDQVSSSPWKAGVSESTQVDRISRRFGYSISSTRDSDSNNSTSGMQRTTPETLGVSTDGIIRSVDNGNLTNVDNGITRSVDKGISRSVANGITRSVDNSISRSVDNEITRSVDNGIIRSVDKGITRSVDNGIRRSVDNGIIRSVDKGITRSVGNVVIRNVDNGNTRSVDNGKRLPIYSSMTTSHRLSITQTPNHSRIPIITAVSVDDTKLLRKDVIDFHKRLRNVINDVKVNQKERDSFLRKWRLQKLRRIAAQRALQSVHGPGSKKPAYWHTSLKNNQVTRPIMRMKGVQTLNSTTPVILLAQPPQLIQQRMGSHVYTTTTVAYTKSPNLQLGNKRGNLRSQLPAWLGKALKFKMNDNKHKSGSKHNNLNFNRENSKLGVRSNETNELKKTVLRPQLADVSLGYGNTRTPKVSTVLNQSRQFPQMSAHTKSTGSSRVHGDYSRTGVDKPREDDLTDSLFTDITDGDATETESLVRYIVSLLISQMKNDNSGENNDKFGARNKSVFGDILLSTLAPSYTIVKDTTSGGLTWLAPGPVSAATTKNYPGSSASKDYQKKDTQPGTTSKSQTDRHYYSQRQHDNLPPSVRGEANAFSGLILGSDFGNIHRFNKNRVEKYHNWRTARLFDKQNIANAKGTSKQTSHSIDNNNIADAGNNAFQKTRKSRSDYKDMRNDQQSSDRWLQSQAQASQETPIDHHHMWSSRAGRRRDHYNRQEDFGKQELVCESLAVLSGGMDRWCTDNCNANFCPSSLCVCTAKASVTSSRLINFPLATPREQMWAHSKQHIGALPRQHSRAVPNEGVFEEFITPINRNSRSDRFITATRPAITKSPQHSTGNNENSYEKLSRHPTITHKPVRKNVHSFSDITNKDKMSLFLENLLDQDTNLQSQEENTNSFGSTKTVPHFFLHSARTLKKQNRPYTFDGAQQTGEKIQFNNYHINEDRDQFPQTARNDIHARFQTLPQMPQLPQRLNWYTNTNSYNLRKINNPGREPDNHEGRTGVFIQPYTSHSQHLNHEASANEAFSKNGIYNRKEATGPVYYNQQKLYSHVPAVEPGVRTRGAHSRLVCKAIGAFAGVRHFEDWCLSTCLTTMCPLTVCSCEQQGSPQLLNGK